MTPNVLLRPARAGLLALLTLGTTFSLPAAADEAPAAVRDALATLLPSRAPDSLKPAPVEGLYEAIFGTSLLYVTADGRHVIQGTILDAKTREDLTEPALNGAKLAALGQVGEDKMLVFGPADPTHTLTVFTDIDCGYCRKLHAEMAQFEDQGIQIRYLFYPRAGADSESYRKAVSVWCAEDQHAAMTAAKAGEAVPEASCDNPVSQHMALGRAFGIQGTPALVLEDGELIPGYIPAERLKRALDARAASAVN